MAEEFGVKPNEDLTFQVLVVLPFDPIRHNIRHDEDEDDGGDAKRATDRGAMRLASRTDEVDRDGYTGSTAAQVRPKELPHSNECKNNREEHGRDQQHVLGDVGEADVRLSAVEDAVGAVLAEGLCIILWSLSHSSHDHLGPPVPEQLRHALGRRRAMCKRVRSMADRERIRTEHLLQPRDDRQKDALVARHSLQLGQFHAHRTGIKLRV